MTAPHDAAKLGCGCTPIDVAVDKLSAHIPENVEWRAQSDVAHLDALPPPPPSLPEVLSKAARISTNVGIAVSKLIYSPSTATFHSALSAQAGIGVAVKFGARVRRSEAEALRLVARRAPHVPIPEVIAVYEHETFVTIDDDEDFDVGKAKVTYIVMSWVEGTPLGDVWADLQESEKNRVVKQVKSLLATLRHMGRDGQEKYIGSAAGLPCADPIIADKGPFENVQGLNKALLKAVRPHISAHYVSVVQRALQATTAQGVVFTHGDIHPRNILVQRVRRPASDGQGPSLCVHDTLGVEITGILDWEMAGWYPEYWEYVAAMQLDTSEWENGGWGEYARGILDATYDLESLLVEVLLTMV